MQLELPREIRLRMLSALSTAKRLEIGGILMAEQIEPGVFTLVDFSIDPNEGSAAHFVRSSEHHRIALEDFFARTGQEYSRFNYLGEWHSHPNHLPVPSSIDIRSMDDLIYGERNIPFAVLLIVRRGWWRRFQCSATIFQQGQSPQPMKIVSG